MPKKNDSKKTVNTMQTAVVKPVCPCSKCVDQDGCDLPAYCKKYKSWKRKYKSMKRIF